MAGISTIDEPDDGVGEGTAAVAVMDRTGLVLIVAVVDAVVRVMVGVVLGAMSDVVLSVVVRVVAGLLVRRLVTAVRVVGSGIGAPKKYL